MNLILSIFLCFALAFGGAAELPAEPETATTWTIRNVTLSNGGETFALNPEARLTAALGAEKAALHFEIENDGRIFLPISAEVTPDELTFALSGGGRAYSLTNEEFMKLIDVDEEDIRILNLCGDLFTSYGALLGMAYGDEAQMAEFSQAVLEAMLGSFGSEFETVEIELDGETLSAQRTEFDLTFRSSLEMIDALRDCGIDELTTFLNALLEIINLDEETDYPNYTALIEAIPEADLDSFSMPLTLTFAEADGLSYGLVETTADLEDFSHMQMREEVVTRGGETSVAVNMLMNADDTVIVYDVSAQMTGPLNAPESMHMDYDVTAVNLITGEGGDGAESISTAMRMTLDAATADGLSDATLEASVTVTPNAESSSFDLRATASDRREADGSVTADVTFELLTEDIDAGVSFELNRAESAYANPFDGADLFEITEDAFDSDADEMPPVAAALTADVALMSVDAMQLGADESIRALIDQDIVYDDEEDDDYAEVDSLEEAAALFEGTIPDFTPPEGYEIISIDAEPSYVLIDYAADEMDGFEMYVYVSLATVDTYTYGGGALAPVEGQAVQIREYDGDISGAELILSDGTVVSLYFYGSPALEDVEAILAGFAL